MRRPERYQLAFDFALPSQEVRPSYLVKPNTFAQFNSREPEINRFVRVLKEPVTIHTPYEAAHHLMNRIYTPFANFDQEEVWVLLLNTQYRITHEAMIYRGTINCVPVRVAEIFKEAVRVNAPTILLSHCHPSGVPQQSPEDVQLTATAYAASRILGIELLDHIIVGDGSWLSMRDQGIGFGEEVSRPT